ncbi:methionyl-tRNA formyltransferase [Paraburkholderia sp. NMBU_R16]|nr:methionyl-tRNA formyltransferase [Paraburkholderia sp. NMBU_R16]
MARTLAQVRRTKTRAPARVVFMGYQTWGVRTLSALLEAGHQVVLVVTHPPSDHPYERIWNESVQALAKCHLIPVHECVRANSAQLLERCALLEPDLFVLSDWRTWLDSGVYRTARFGGINIHDALLPRYGGFAPLNWAIANGESEVGVTVHQLSELLDLGDIIAQRSVAVGPDDTATDLFFRTLPLFGTLAVEAVELIMTGRAQPVAQDAGAATFFHKRTARECSIDWQRSASEIHNLVRAQSPPYPSAFTAYRGRPLKLLSTRFSQRAYRGTPGRLCCREADGVVVVTGGAAPPALVLRTVCEADGAPIAANDYFRQLGEYFDPIPSEWYRTHSRAPQAEASVL